MQLFFVVLVIFLFVADHTVHVEFAPLTPEYAAMIPPWIRWILPISARINAHGGDFLGLMHQSSEIFVAVLGLIDNYSNWGNLLVFVMAAHLFVHMRDVYGSLSAGTVTRMALLGLGTLIAYSILTIAWVAAAYFELTI